MDDTRRLRTRHIPLRVKLAELGSDGQGSDTDFNQFCLQRR